MQKLAYTVPAGMIFPSLLNSCAPPEPISKFLYEGKVIIIGAGIAGLQAAQQIKNQNINVEVLEASDVYGGRIKINPEFFDYPIEQGADFIYGDKNPWFDAVKNSGISIVEVTKNPVYVMDGVPKFDSELTQDIDYQNAQSYINNLKNYTGPDLTLQNSVVSAQIPTRAHHVIEGVMATPRGTSYNNISVKGLTDNLKKWNDGEGKYFSQNQGHIKVLGNIYGDVIPLIKFNTPVKTIDYSSPSKIIITDSEGNTHECTRVILTVPLAVLKSNTISFTPTLPIGTTAAWNRIGMSGGIKVVLKFFSNFWGMQTSSIYTQGYAREYYAAGIGRSDSNRVLTATIMGDQATALADKSDEEIITLLLADLDAIYSGKASHNYDPTQTYVFDWSKQEYIKGAISYPIVSGTDAEKLIAKPIQNRLFWAGEATALNGNSGTVQGAMESSDRVVAELFDIILDL